MITILIPAYNEKEGLPLAIKTISKAYEGPQPLEFLVIDDGSTDGSFEVLKNLAKKDKRLRAIRFSRNFGKEAALIAGLDLARGDAVILIDADLQHPPTLIPKLIEAWEGGADVVEAVKSTRGKESKLSKLFANGFYRLFKLASGLDLQNASDYRLLDRKVVEALKACKEQNAFFRGLSSWVGFDRVQIPFEVAERSKGESRWSKAALLKLALNALTAFSTRPLHAIALAGALLVLSFFLLSLQTLLNWASGHAASGFTTVILLQLLIGGAILLALALIGLYLARIYEEVKGRPRYLISEDTERSA